MTGYAAEHKAAITRRFDGAAPPRTFDGLLRWFLAAWAEELPPRLHTRGVWRDYGPHAEGGSRLGSPQVANAFRQYLESSPAQTDALLGEDERGAVYRRPVHATLYRMTYGNGMRPFMARFLFALACSGGDWRSIAPHYGAGNDHIGLIWTQECLRRIYLEYRAEPETRAVA